MNRSICFQSEGGSCFDFNPRDIRSAVGAVLTPSSKSGARRSSEVQYFVPARCSGTRQVFVPTLGRPTTKSVVRYVQGIGSHRRPRDATAHQGGFALELSGFHDIDDRDDA